MKYLVLIACISAFAAVAFAQEAQSRRAPRILIAYFSHTNTTRTVAEMIQQQIGGDLFHIATRNPYPQNHQQTVNIARGEVDRNERPALAATIRPDILAQYDIVFLGYPNWWMTMPMAVRTFLDQHDMAGKTIIPFCTHQGSGLSNTVEELRQICTTATVAQGLAINGRAAQRAQNDVANWLRSLGFTSQ